MKTSNKLLCFFITVILSSCTAELAQIAAHPGVNDPYNPYGISTSSNAPLIALGEGWAYHIGHFLADQRYGTSGSNQTEQTGNTFFTGGGAHPHINVLEGFNPNLTADLLDGYQKG